METPLADSSKTQTVSDTADYKKKVMVLEQAIQQVSWQLPCGTFKEELEKELAETKETGDDETSIESTLGRLQRYFGECGKEDTDGSTGSRHSR